MDILGEVYIFPNQFLEKNVSLSNSCMILVTSSLRWPGLFMDSLQTELPPAIQTMSTLL